MKTKLVYVLTCAKEATYIEQALISIYSARYHNPDAHIVLLVDKKTDELLVGKRSEVLDYVTECKVVSAPSDYNVMQVSRWLKTNVRSFIDGDFLFVDCDTVVTQSLKEIDNLDCEIGAVLDTHRPVSKFNPRERVDLIKRADLCGWDFSPVESYYSSGVLFVKDTFYTQRFYQQWHDNYNHSSSCGVNIDQISFERTRQCVSIVKNIDDTYNTIMFIRPKFIEQAKIIHFASLNNNSFLFSKRVLQYIRENGLTLYLKYYIMHPMESYVPYMKKYFKGFAIFKTIRNVTRGVKQYARHIDSSFVDLKIPLRIGKFIKKMYSLKLYYTATLLWMFWIHLTGKYNPLEKYYHGISDNRGEEEEGTLCDPIHPPHRQVEF